MQPSELVNVSIKMNVRQFAALKAFAKGNSVSMSDTVRYAVRNFLLASRDPLDRIERNDMTVASLGLPWN